MSDTNIIELGLSVSIEDSENDDVRKLIEGLKAIGNSIDFNISGGKSDEDTIKGLDSLLKGQRDSDRKTTNMLESTEDSIKRSVSDPTGKILDNQRIMMSDLLSLQNRLIKVSDSNLSTVHQMENAMQFIKDIDEYNPVMKKNQGPAVVSALGGKEGDDPTTLVRNFMEQMSKTALHYQTHGRQVEASKMFTAINAMKQNDWAVADIKKLIALLIESSMKEMMGVELKNVGKTHTQNIILDKKPYTIDFEYNKGISQLRESSKISNILLSKYLGIEERADLLKELENAEGQSSADVLAGLTGTGAHGKLLSGVFGEGGLLNDALVGAESGLKYTSISDIDNNLVSLRKGSPLANLFAKAAPEITGDTYSDDESALAAIGYTGKGTYLKSDKSYGMRELLSMVALMQGGMDEQFELIKEVLGKDKYYPGLMDSALAYYQAMIGRSKSDDINVEHAKRDVRFPPDLVDKILDESLDRDTLAEMFVQAMPNKKSGNASIWRSIIDLIRSADLDENSPYFVELKTLITGGSGTIEALRGIKNTGIVGLMSQTTDFPNSAVVGDMAGGFSGTVDERDKLIAEQKQLSSQLLFAKNISPYTERAGPEAVEARKNENIQIMNRLQEILKELYALSTGGFIKTSQGRNTGETGD